jgi:hypothetical protein
LTADSTKPEAILSPLGGHLKTGLYEKVIKVKADVAAVLVSATVWRQLIFPVTDNHNSR